MNRATRELVASLPCAAIDVVEISGTDWGETGLQFRSYKCLSYPDYDICDRPVGFAVCDLLIAEQVFEHIPNPRKAAQNVFAMLRGGGHFLVTTPFLLKVHPFPQDFYRWTEDGIRFLLEDAGFVNVVTGSWGNRKCLMADMKPGMKWTMYHPMLHSLKNEPQFPIVTWALAEKPQSKKVQ
jgi:SAM-dependent methyltransferase